MVLDCRGDVVFWLPPQPRSGPSLLGTFDLLHELEPQLVQQAHLVGVQRVEADVEIRRFHFFEYSLLIGPAASIAPLLSR